MFYDVGDKLKGLAYLVFWVGIIGSVIYGVVLVVNAGFTGFITAATIAFSSWLSAVVLYGFGQLIENSENLKKQNEELIDIQKKLALNVSQVIHRGNDSAAPISCSEKPKDNNEDSAPANKNAECGQVTTEWVEPIESLLQPDMIKCPRCKMSQSKDNNCCVSCGVCFNKTHSFFR